RFQQLDDIDLPILQPERNPDGSDVNPNTISSGIRLLDAEIPPALCIETMQSLTSLELTMSPYRFSEFTMELSTVISSRIFPNLLGLKILGERPFEDKASLFLKMINSRIFPNLLGPKILGERPIEDKASLFLKKTPFQQFLVGLSDALALRAVTIENTKMVIGYALPLTSVPASSTLTSGSSCYVVPNNSWTTSTLFSQDFKNSACVGGSRRKVLVSS
ncbi:hypothetical protein CF319_g9091, partial [Tilletia indica]